MTDDKEHQLPWSYYYAAMPALFLLVFLLTVQVLVGIDTFTDLTADEALFVAGVP